MARCRRETLEICLQLARYRRATTDRNQQWTCQGNLLIIITLTRRQLHTVKLISLRQLRRWQVEDHVHHEAFLYASGLIAETCPTCYGKVDSNAANVCHQNCMGIKGCRMEGILTANAGPRCKGTVGLFKLDPHGDLTLSSRLSLSLFRGSWKFQPLS